MFNLHISNGREIDHFHVFIGTFYLWKYLAVSVYSKLLVLCPEKFFSRCLGCPFPMLDVSLTVSFLFLPKMSVGRVTSDSISDCSNYHQVLASW